jgi:hypothetical protein
MGGLILALLLLLLSGKIKSTTPTEELGLLIDHNNIQISMALDSVRLSLVVIMNSSETMRKEPFMRVRQVKNTWQNYDIFKNTGPMALEFKNGLDMAEADFKLAGEASKYLFSLLRNDQSIQPKTDCLLNLNLLNWAEFESDSLQLMLLQEKISASTPQEVTQNYDKMYNLLGLYRETALSWREKTTELLEHWSLLSNLVFPQDLYDQLGGAACLKDSKSELIKVLMCEAGTDIFICELEINQPIQTSWFTHMKPIKYNGLILSGLNPDILYVKDRISNQVSSLYCPEEQPISVPANAPFCEQYTLNAICEHYLNTKDLGGAITNCYFREAKGKSLAIRTIDDSVLILDSTAKIIVDGRPIFEPVPLRVYANTSIILVLGKGEIKYVSTSKIAKTQIIKSKITGPELIRMQWNAYWLKTGEAIQAWDLLDIFLLILELLTVPFLLTNLICNLQNRKQIERARNAKQTKKRRRKSNFAENRELLRENRSASTRT